MDWGEGRENKRVLLGRILYEAGSKKPGDLPMSAGNQIALRRYTWRTIIRKESNRGKYRLICNAERKTLPLITLQKNNMHTKSGNTTPFYHPIKLIKNTYIAIEITIELNIMASHLSSIYFWIREWEDLIPDQRSFRILGRVCGLLSDTWSLRNVNK